MLSFAAGSVSEAVLSMQLQAQTTLHVMLATAYNPRASHTIRCVLTIKAMHAGQAGCGLCIRPEANRGRACSNRAGAFT